MKIFLLSAVFSCLFVVDPVVALCSREEPLQIGYIEAPPFARENPEYAGGVEGFEAALIRSYARELGCSFTFTKFAPSSTVSPGDVLVKAVSQENVSVGIGGINITDWRLDSGVEFSSSTLIQKNGKSIITRREGPPLVARILRVGGRLLFSPLAATLVVLWFLVLWLERRSLEESIRASGAQFESRSVRGRFMLLLQGAYFVLSLVPTFGLGDVCPKTFPGKLILMSTAWVIGLLFTGSFVAIISEEFAPQPPKIADSTDIPGSAFAVRSGSSTEQQIRSLGGKPIGTSSIEESLKLLEEATVDGVPGDTVYIEEVFRDFRLEKRDMVLSPVELAATPIGAVFSGSSQDERRRFDLWLVRQQTGGGYDTIFREYFE